MLSQYIVINVFNAIYCYKCFAAHYYKCTYKLADRLAVSVARFSPADSR